MPPNTGVEERYVDHFDGGLIQSERSQLVDNEEGESRRSSDKERSHPRGKDVEKGRDQCPTPADDRSLQTSVPSSEDTFERSRRGDAPGGLKDGERNRTRRKEPGSWAEETGRRLEDDQKAYSAFESEVDVGRSSRKDEGRSATQYSRQDRRKSQRLLFVASRLLSANLSK